MVLDDLMEEDVRLDDVSGQTGMEGPEYFTPDGDEQTETVMRRFREVSADRRPFYDAFVSAAGGGKSAFGRWQAKREELNGIGRAIGGVVGAFPASTGVRSSDRPVDGAEPAFYRIHRDRMGRFSDRNFPAMDGNAVRRGVRQGERRNRPVLPDNGMRNRLVAGLPRQEKKLGLNWNVEE